ncbi:MAG: DUF2183 domain-containing protein [Candidatus Riflebacteria bacterium]|nr:DUF2183 domain-containing protein [Candidatus Riflebacteria bacterium]
MRTVIMVVLLSFIGAGVLSAQNVQEARVFPLFREKLLFIEGRVDNLKSREGFSTRDRLRGLLSKFVASMPLDIYFNDGFHLPAQVSENGYFRATTPIRTGVNSLKIRSGDTVLFTHDFQIPSKVDFIMVSDIDDTVMLSEVTNKAKLVWNSLWKNFDKRSAIPGTPELYRRLATGESILGNPVIIYLTGSPAFMSKYLQGFFKKCEFPMGTIITKSSIKSSKQHDHKGEWLKHLTAIYPGKPFLLFGDSGEHDPEIYTTFAESCKAPVLGVIINHVKPTKENNQKLERCRTRLNALKIPFLIWDKEKDLKAATEKAWFTN